MGLDKGWTDSIDAAKSDPRWTQYDKAIQDEIAAYNRRFWMTPGYTPVDWRWIKAMVWVESGGPDYEKGVPWKTRPLQIGNPGDPGMDVLRREEQGSTLIMPAGLYAHLFQMCLIPDYAPVANIRAGIAYLFTRMSKKEYRSVIDPMDSSVHTHTVKKGDSYDAIAASENTTRAELIARNPSIKEPYPLRIGATVQFHRATMELQIVGWLKFDAKTIKLRYNSEDPKKGDVNYDAKLDYIWKNVFTQPAAAPSPYTPFPPLMSVPPR